MPVMTVPEAQLLGVDGQSDDMAGSCGAKSPRLGVVQPDQGNPCRPERLCSRVFTSHSTQIGMAGDQ